MFSLVVMHNFIWVLLAIIFLFDLQLKQVDVKITFLHGKLEEMIYMH
jgi:hypothetical protein